jgi:hypothetical protein
MRSLLTDYRDSYDIWFEDYGPTFKRMARESWSISRQDMFHFFEKVGLQTPKWGPCSSFLPDTKVVAYTDIFAHCGEGKDLIVAKDGGDTLASEYVDEEVGVCYRYFNLAGQGAWFLHKSFDSWKSNCGDGDLGKMPTRFHTQGIERALGTLKNPLYAIDFVERKKGLLAIDFNPAPRLSGTPANWILQQKFGSNHQIYLAIDNWLNKLVGNQDFDNNQIFL